ncbi:hypothetical protein ACWGB8_33950 [Kitasatospora sp. NPDC054939]
MNEGHGGHGRHPQGTQGDPTGGWQQAPGAQGGPYAPQPAYPQEPGHPQGPGPQSYGQGFEQTGPQAYGQGFPQTGGPGPAPAGVPAGGQQPYEAVPGQPPGGLPYGQGLDSPTMTLSRQDPAAPQQARPPYPQQQQQQQPPYAQPPQGPPPQAGQPHGHPLDNPTMALPRQAPVAAPPFPQAPQAPQPPFPQPPAAPAGPRARTGSPIIDPGLQPALITAGAAALLAGGAAIGVPALAVVVAVLQVLTAAGWFRLNGMWPARQGIALAALAGLVADAAVLLAGRSGGAAAAVGTLGGFFLLVLVLQTFRPSDPAERFYALTVLGSATVVTVLCTALLLSDWVPAAVGAVALATLLAAAPLPGPKQVGPVLGLVAAVVFGLAVGAPPALGVLAGLGALLGRRVAAYDFPSRFVHVTAGVALPLAVSAPLIWVATRLLAG